ncbi:MAG: outer membrane protein [Candidatus Promineifilaceae bacterium]
MNKTMLAIGTIIIVAGSTLAEAGQGTYVGLNLGAAIPNDSDVTESVYGYDVSYSVEAGTGFAAGATVGYVFANNFRVEGEFAYQKNDLDKIKVLGFNLNANGDIESLGLLLNGYYEYVDKSGIILNIGGGIGFMNVAANDFNIEGSGVSNVDDDDTVFAYQAGVGIGYAINAKLAIDLKYRYMGTDNPNFGGAEVEYSTNNIYAGIRFGF